VYDSCWDATITQTELSSQEIVIVLMLHKRLFRVGKLTSVLSGAAKHSEALVNVE